MFYVRHLKACKGESDATSAHRRRAAAATASASQQSPAPVPAVVTPPEIPHHEEMTYAEFVHCEHGTGEDDVECETCSICLEQFDLDTPVKKLPCNHIFHPACVDIWFEVSAR